MAVGDKVSSWKTWYEQINRVIDLGVDSGITISKLNPANVTTGDMLDNNSSEKDLDALVDAIAALKRDSRYSSTSQLDPSTHKSITFNVFSATPVKGSQGAKVKETERNPVDTVMTNIQKIKCHNRATCNNAIEYYDGSYTGCNDGPFYSCSQSYYTCTPWSDCGANGGGNYATCSGWYVSSAGYTCYSFKTYYGSACYLCASDGCGAGSRCSQSIKTYYTSKSCVNKTTYTTCSNETATDILCINSTWVK